MTARGRPDPTYSKSTCQWPRRTMLSLGNTTTLFGNITPSPSSMRYATRGLRRFHDGTRQAGSDLLKVYLPCRAKRQARLPCNALLAVFGDSRKACGSTYSMSNIRLYLPMAPDVADKVEEPKVMQVRVVDVPCRRCMSTRRLKPGALRPHGQLLWAAGDVSPLGMIV